MKQRCECWDECFQDHGLQCPRPGLVQIQDVTGSCRDYFLCAPCSRAYVEAGPWKVAPKSNPKSNQVVVLKSFGLVVQKGA